MARIIIKPKTYNDYLNEACAKGDMEAIMYKRSLSRKGIAWTRIAEKIRIQDREDYAVEDESGIEV